MFNQLLETGIIILAYMTFIFIIAIIIKNNSIVDIFWGFGFILIMLYSCKIQLSDYLLINVFNFLVLIWGIRLSTHIFIRNFGKEEDFRYKKWRETWKYFYLRSFLQIFLLQGFIMWVISIPIIKINFENSKNFYFQFYLGILIFIIGFIFETVSDYQLLKFKRNNINKGKIITSGLWKFSRHPNYFGEAMLWWGLSIMVINKVEDIYVFISPLVISFLLRYVSGVPMLEEKYKNNSDFKEYSKKTSIFFPLLQKNNRVI